MSSHISKQEAGDIYNSRILIPWQRPNPEKHGRTSNSNYRHLLRNPEHPSKQERNRRVHMT